MIRVPKGTNQVITLLTFISLITGIWYIWHIDNWGLTPERAASRDGYCENAPIMKTQQQTATTAVVVCQGLAGSQDGGYVLVTRLPWGVWWASPNGGNFSYQSSEVISTDLVDYIHAGPTQSVYTSLILLGRSQSTEVAAIEAKLSNGRTLKDNVTNGLFIFDAPIRAVGVQVDELKVIGQNNQILQLIKVKPGY
ncbi:MAG: hypothetical protein NW224_23305 [Leptolyngbyaceae cyanobacterium bins.302]|nr:hypothetical protein [Leptolyngbyaceae cyanobacterium bins.302]